MLGSEGGGGEQKEEESARKASDVIIISSFAFEFPFFLNEIPLLRKPLQSSPRQPFNNFIPFIVSIKRLRIEMEPAFIIINDDVILLE